MGRRFNIVRPVKLHTHIPEDLRAKLDLHLYSELEGRIPIGAYARFFEQLLKDYFSRKTLALKDNLQVSGSPEAIEHLKLLLQKD